MTAYTAGQQVMVQKSGSSWSQNLWMPDTVKRVTAASVITEKNGAFRLTSMTLDGLISRHSSGGWYSMTLAPVDHPRVQRDLAEQAATVRRSKRERVGRTHPAEEDDE